MVLGAEAVGAEDNIKIKKTTFYFILVLILIVGAGFFFLKSGNSQTNGNTATGNGEVQKIVISERNSNYYPQTITVKVNQPVSISLDSSVQGCLRSFTIKEFGVAKYLATPQDAVVFTPTKTGTFTFACSMGMGFGKLIVE